MSDVLRIIDANANRAREALRVMEEAARFILNHATLTETVKLMRHDLTDAMTPLDHAIHWRHTPGDVGTQLSTDNENSRENTFDVAAAACKRLTEALRAIEEYGKTLTHIAPKLPNQIEQMRYHAYDIEQSLLRCLVTNRPAQYRLCVLITESLCLHHHWFDVAEAAVRGGADCIQLREKQLDDRELLDRAARLVEYCRRKDAAVIINDRPDIALLAGADGVHLGQNDLPAQQVRKLAGRRLVIGASTSNIDQAESALSNGADYCGVGPMFPSSTKHKETIAGTTYLKQYLQWNKLPHLAIGGIGPDNISDLVQHSVKGIAVSACICQSKIPEEDTRKLAQRLIDAPPHLNSQ